MPTINEMEATPPPPETTAELVWDFDPDTAINLLNDCREHLDHLQMLDEKGNFLTRNRRLGLAGVIDELTAFLDGDE